MKKKLLIGMFIGTLMLLGVTSNSKATPVHYEINAGGFGYETSWAINQISGGAFSAGQATGSMASNVNYIYDWDLGEGLYQLTMADTFGDGLDSGGSAYLSVNSVVLLNHVGNLFGSSYLLEFEVPRADAVPEPATMLLLGTGLVGVAGAARRKKKNQA